MPTRVVIAAGGTAGHVVPALAVADELRADGVEVVFLGGERAEAEAVPGGGGYVAGPVGLAAALERIPLVLTEADSRLGLSNRLLAPFARRVCLAFPIPERTGDRFRVTGRPISPPATDRRAARARFDLGPKDVCVLVFGGSLGARSLNQAALTAFADVDFRVLHAAGRRDYEALAPRSE